jgi:glycine/D-amino acid oxidase-like deaminating enzyme
MRRAAHPWGTPPWTIDFRPASGPLPEHVDFAIVGGGFAGLSAAAWLARLAPSKSVLLLESESLGNGASGRTGGMVLDQSAVGPLPGLGKVLAGYRKILGVLKVDAELTLPGVWELARRKSPTKSPICWNDSGELRGVHKVPGGSVNPGKVVAGLARAAERARAQIAEHAEVLELEPAARSAPGAPVRLHISIKSGRRTHRTLITANDVLLATNAGSLTLSGLAKIAEPKLTLALATEPLNPAQIRALGLASRRPFYTLDFPYLWGRLLENDAVIFGAGLLPRPRSASSPFLGHHPLRQPRLGFGDLLRFHAARGATRECLDWLETRVHNLHPSLKNIRITHRWGGPILFTQDFRPVFQRHPRSRQILILGAFAGHGVALSVYLGHWAAQSLLGLRALPRWGRS